MASTVDTAFKDFLEGSVRLDSDVTTRARGSRSWLIGQLHALADGTTDLPDPYEENTLSYGSFSRRTKIRELDDIDLILALKANGATYSFVGATYTLHVPESAKHLRTLCNPGSDTLNSKKVINRIIKELSRIPQYARSDIKRNESAAVLNLSSHAWTFDIVPAFFTAQEADGRQYYLIPDGRGTWMKTDPRVDKNNVTSTNRDHDGNLLDLIRIAKYWNRRKTMPSIGSYLLECIVVEFAQGCATKLGRYPDVNFLVFLEHLAGAIYRPVYDPKGIDGDINNIDLFDQIKIAEVAMRDLQRGGEARQLEGQDNHGSAISKWREIFGTEFPAHS